MHFAPSRLFVDENEKLSFALGTQAIPAASSSQLPVAPPAVPPPLATGKQKFLSIGARSKQEARADVRSKK